MSCSTPSLGEAREGDRDGVRNGAPRKPGPAARVTVNRTFVIKRQIERIGSGGSSSEAGRLSSALRLEACAGEAHASLPSRQPCAAQQSTASRRSGRWR